ncbi:MAG: pyridoxamine kinase [Lachnospiraceae bacterium]|nr:pyridoxamine kinase [Lachnospiraceae bacterium]
MNRKVAVINDLSGFGRCSLTAAISVLSAMGAQSCPLPTAVLSAQTGFPSYYCLDLVETMPKFTEEWQKLDVCFKGIYTGFVTNERQIAHIFSFLEVFHQKDTFLLVDPIMGDDGILYDMFSTSLLERMKALVKEADVVTPNLTELCLLVDQDVAEVLTIAETAVLLKKIKHMAEVLLGKGTKQVVVTGIRFLDETTKEKRMGNFIATDTERKLIDFPYVDASFSGTGDLFASVLVGGMVRGDDLGQTVGLAGDFIEKSLRNAVAEDIDYNDGINFEQNLQMLMNFSR